MGCSLELLLCGHLFVVGMDGAGGGGAVLCCASRMVWQYKALCGAVAERFGAAHVNARYSREWTLIFWSMRITRLEGDA